MDYRLYSKTNYMDFVIFCIVFLILVGLNLGIHSYIIYSFVILLFFIRFKYLTLVPRNSICVPFVLIILFSFTKIWQISTRTLFESVFLLLAIICFFGRKRFDVNIKRLNTLIALALFANLFLSRQSLHVDMNGFSHSDIGYESPIFSFILPFFLYYWLNRRKYFFCLLNAPLILLSGKRIALIAVIVGLLFFFFQNRLRNLNRNLIKAVILFANFSYLQITFLLSSGSFDYISYQLFDVSVSQFTMGRYELYAYIIEKVEIFSNFRWLYGIGLGNTEKILNAFIEHSILHNDILKLFLETGGVATFFFFYFLYNTKMFWQWGYLIIWNVILMTDNTLIYVPIVFALCLMIDAESIALQKRNYRISLE